MLTTFSLILLVRATAAYPWVANAPGVDSSMLEGYRNRPRQQPSPRSCPFNVDHTNAAPITDEYPYNGAKNGVPGKGVGGYQVPAPGDTAHAFEAPGPNDIRGPCPGLNTAANHHVSQHSLASVIYYLH